VDKRLLGIHHITAIAGEPQENMDFYAGVLGLRLVKLTVNFDDPGTYHLYYGDGIGHPGTIMTFFPWPKAPKGRKGTGQVTATAFAVPKGTIAYWAERLDEHRIAHGEPVDRFGEQVLSCTDPDGLAIELIAAANLGAERAYIEGPVPVNYAIHGFHGATLTEAGYQRTASLLTDTMGFRLIQQEGTRFRYALEAGDPGTLADVVCAPEERSGRVAVGTVHHIAWRTADDEQQDSWQKHLARAGYDVTPIIDRKYFHSIYYPEPGGILFEVATDPPGFATDETPEELGSKLQLPPWLEPSREELLATLPRLRLPAAARSVPK
jgi:catechol 2,3-dioxygenase-like lactoylglutathione lyase family enzyme